MRFIKLTGIMDNTLFLAQNKIESMRIDTSSDPKLPPQTIIKFDSSDYFFVKESPEQILAKMHHDIDWSP